MKLFALDPAKFADYMKEGLCPGCGRQRLEGEIHMSNGTFNHILTWGCYVQDDNNPKLPGLLIPR